LGYTHPGRLFVQEHGLPQSLDDVLRYAAFLRAEAGLSDEPPIDLASIYRRFEIPAPRKADLKGQQGLLLNPDSGLIILNENDMPARQRFTEAHELMELLFSQMPGGNAWAARGYGRFRPAAKEKLCNSGAAELLVPRSSFLPRVNQRGVSIATAWQLAKEYQVSTTAAMVNMARFGPGEHAVVVWRHKLKQSEMRGKAPASQIPLFRGSGSPEPTKQLRVEWAIGSDGGAYIPREKSAPKDSSIYQAWERGGDTADEDVLELGQVHGRCRCENHPFDGGGERQVISLLHLPGDWCHLEDPDEEIPF
jgi:Zn-dependent peptidase ImmA (M78 family)